MRLQLTAKSIVQKIQVPKKAFSFALVLTFMSGCWWTTENLQHCCFRRQLL